MNQDEVIKILRKHIEGAKSLRALARKWSLSAAYLSDVMLKKRFPGKKILHKIGLQAHIKVTRTFEARRK
jgi:hypothetical protein